MYKKDEPFWRTKSLSQMTQAEWESLCDGCGRCCLVKLEDEDTDEVAYTNVACRLFDDNTCRCIDYANRTSKVSDCLALTSDKLAEISWLPPTCAYRLIDEGRELYWWHPLVSGDLQTVHVAGVSVRGRTVSEQAVTQDELFDSVVPWPLYEYSADESSEPD